MATSLQIACEVLPHFEANALNGHTRTYGFYAQAIGRNPAKDAMAIGKAMHIIGAACIMAAVPVAPIHFVDRADGEWRGIFERSALERTYLLPHWDVLVVSSRAHKYTSDEFRTMAILLNDRVPTVFPEDMQTPDKIWQILIPMRDHRANGERTLLQTALIRYEQIIAEAKARRPARS
ncbi:MAG TPA: hypothetical protein VLJ57_01360 [Burkholderiaceae bacterium]|nr:hypothetical protein [Burkholderiaceae bacterium]